jgi:hypothetical protein
MTGFAHIPRHSEHEIARVNYHGWPGCYVLTNGLVEAVVVPAVGRVMQFRFVGDNRGVFWENRDLDGMPPQSRSNWMNFGGDKAWPAPQENWEKVSGRAWPPPAGFDSVSVEARVRGQELTTSSPVAPSYGVQVFRHVAMRPGIPAMVITTRYCKVSGPPVKAGVWIVTQLRDPERVFVLLPEPASEFIQIAGPRPFDLQKEGRLLSLRRDPSHNVKVAMDAVSLLWMDDRYILRIDGHSAQKEHATCRSSVYTNADPLSYVELETVGPITRMVVGDHLDLTNTYTLARRSLEDATAEAHNAFSLNCRDRDIWTHARQ